MNHLVIITPKSGTFEKYMRRRPQVYIYRSESANYAYFSLASVFSPNKTVCQILSKFNFKEFSLDKETDYYRFKVYVE